MGLEEDIRKIQLPVGTPIEIECWDYWDNHRPHIPSSEKSYKTRIGYYIGIENHELIYSDRKPLGRISVTIPFDSAIAGITKIKVLKSKK